MALEKKKDETRNSLTKYRGEVAICAARKWTPQLRAVALREPFFSALMEGAEGSAPIDDAFKMIAATPLGCVVSVGDLYDSMSSEEWMELFFPEGWEPTAERLRERAFGNYAPGRGVWRMRNMRRLATPIPVIGRQFWFNLPPDVEAAVRAQL
jgi:hypothetical protein